MTWDERWIQESELKASWSKDRSTKVGAVIVGADNIPVANGWNGFPRNCDDNVSERHERPLKYKWTEHAERNAIYNAAFKGYSTANTSIYCTMFPCTDCARGIIQSGIVRVVTQKPDFNHPTYGEDFRIVEEMFAEVGIIVQFIDDLNIDSIALKQI